MRQSVRRIVPHSRERIFDLVADVERYPEFLPMWQQARVLSGGAEHYRTEQALGIGPARLEFVSETFLERPERIVVVADHAPVRRLRLDWTFTDMGPNRCQVALNMVVEVQSRMLQKLIQAMSGDLVPRLMSSFEARARAMSRSSDPSRSDPTRLETVRATVPVGDGSLPSSVEPARGGLR
ncbi:type II toxin-antitoxin system RatA family toxin [Roseospira visakhapatnamensis]|uniref:Coenzyme Q-binding protein COQ10 n=1 Tax=Roseospira visakhapatnamensis TaxID=390880 RepID=A0A7W6RCP0_9PROT|nr:type II toxin-antitoxin system RatA family toxin [Roseospira visakhapatnamensis]MBB4265987.1 coenzyme Q-binding protein COQ10 [Roseospira visakhapatnamensis]